MFTKKDVFEMLDDGSSHRKQFSQNTGIQKNKDRPTFHVPFDNGLCSHFFNGTGKRLTFNPKVNTHYCFLRNESDIALAESWVERQGTRVFIRNLMASTVALDYNFFDNKTGSKTEIGRLEEAAKHQCDQVAIDELIAKASDVISDISALEACTCIAPVPAMAEKGFDLPTTLARRLAVKLGKYDLSSSLVLSGKTASAKNCSVDEKWDAWQAANLQIEASVLSGQPVLLVDDKYQSGLTMQFIASKLLEAGAASVHGIVMVKTLRDTDNVDVVES